MSKTFLRLVVLQSFKLRLASVSLRVCVASNILTYISRGEKLGHHTNKCICIYCFIFMTASSPNFDFAALSDHPPSAAGYAEFFFSFFFSFSLLMWSQLAPLPKLWTAIQYELAELRVRTYSEYRVYWLCPWNWGLSTKQISLSEGFSRGATRSASLCRQHILFTASAPGKAFIPQQAQTLRHGNGGLCWQLFCLCAQRAHSSAKGQAACWWAEAVYTDVALGRQG